MRRFAAILLLAACAGPAFARNSHRASSSHKNSHAGENRHWIAPHSAAPRPEKHPARAKAPGAAIHTHSGVSSGKHSGSPQTTPSQATPAQSTTP
jgi:hypothetical protein